MQPAEHHQVQVVVGARAAYVDIAISELIRACWQANVDTFMSCQGRTAAAGERVWLRCLACIDRPTDERCCRQATKTFDAWDLRWLHHDKTPYGSTGWYESECRRNIVEGFNGILKNQAVTGVGWAHHHFFGIAKTTLAAAFATAACNMHLLETWRHRLHTTTTGVPKNNAGLRALAGGSDDPFPRALRDDAGKVDTGDP